MAEDKERVQGHFWNAKRELPQSFSMQVFCMDVGASTGTRTAVIAHHKDACQSVSVFHLCNIIYPAAGTRFVSLNGFNSLVTFGQPWHNCAINVTDSFAGCSWLVLNHHYVAVYSTDTLFHRLFLVPYFLFVLSRCTVFFLINCKAAYWISCNLHAKGKLWHMAIFFLVVYRKQSHNHIRNMSQCHNI